MSLHARLCSIDEVDIDVHPGLAPNPEHRAAEGREWTIGDLHGNLMKLMFFLTYHGYISIEPAQYEAIKNIYRKPLYIEQTLNFSHADIEVFKRALSTITVMHKHSIARLIGDVLADRGENDVLTLLLIAQLRRDGLDLEILLSNHDYEFINSVETEDSPARLFSGNESYFRSILCAEILYLEGIISQKEISDLYENYYKPCLKLAACSLNEAKNDITHYSHALIGRETIEDHCANLGVIYDNSTAEKLAFTIECINYAFSYKIYANKIHEIIDRTAYQNIATMSNVERKEHSFVVAIQNRNPVGLSREERVNNYHNNYVHGHDLQYPSHRNVFNLDNYLGKSPFIHKGQYQVLCFQAKPFVLELQASTSSSSDIEYAPEVKMPLAVSWQAPAPTYTPSLSAAASSTSAPILREATPEEVLALLEKFKF